ncbi:MAG: SH3 domain-containing protein [Anaerolineae bacterium]|nr:SH3 domain-containing protein [Anaerolineae bacterium]
MKRPFWAVSAALVLVGVLVVGGVMPVRSQQDESVPLVLAYYGPVESQAALGMLVAVEEINALGPFVAADGGRYRLQGRVTQDPSALQDAVAVFMDNQSPPLEAPLELAVPVMLLSSSDPTDIPNLQAPVFRAKSRDTALLSALAQYLAEFETARVSLVGADDAFGESLTVLESDLRAADQTGQLVVQRVAEAIPSTDQIAQILSLDPQALVYRGAVPDLNTLILALSEGGWQGAIIYEDALEAIQQGTLNRPPDLQVIGMAPWVSSLQDDLSAAFTLSFISRTGRAPDATAVSAYDTTYALQLLLERNGPNPGTLAQVLPNTTGIFTIQGQVAPALYEGNVLFQTAVVYQVEPLGGTRPLARFEGGEIVPVDDVLADSPPTLTPTPFPSATPSVAQATVLENNLRVRTGPGFDYDIVGRVNRGEVLVVVGANPQYSWWNVQTRFGLGWVLGEFVDVFVPSGLVTDIPQVPIPPTPTPAPTNTPAPTEAAPDIIVENVTLNPPRPISGQPFTATVTVRNTGTAPVGLFAVAASWEPGAVFASFVFENGLGANATGTATLTQTVTGAGTFSIEVVGDLNDTVDEVNEGNNNFTVNYSVDAAAVLSATGAFTAPINVTLAGAAVDFEWTGAALNAPAGNNLGVIGGVTFENATVNLLTSGAVNASSVAVGTPGTVLGIRTAEGECGFLRVDGVSGSTLTLTYRFYSAAACPP